MFTSRPSVTVSMEWDSINCVNGRDILKEYYFPNRITKPGLWHSQLCYRALRLSWEIIPGLFGPSWNLTGYYPHFRGRGNCPILSQKDWLQFAGLLLCLVFRRHWCGHRKYYICPALLYQPPNYSPKLDCYTLALQNTLWLHFHVLIQYK